MAEESFGWTSSGSGGGGGGYTTIQDEGSALTQTNIIDFQGSGVTASNGSGKTIVTVPTQQAYTTIQDEGSALTQTNTIDFQGSGVTASNGSGKTIVTVPTQQAYTTIQDEGSALTQTNTIDFQGSGVTASNGSGKTIVTIAGSPATNSYGLFAQTADGTPVTATTVETNIIGTGVGTLTVPANEFSIGDSFQASLDGILSCVGTATLHIHVKTLAGVILADTGIINMDTATSKSWLLTLYFTIRNIGVTAQWNTTNAGNSIFTRNFTLNKIY